MITFLDLLILLFCCGSKLIYLPNWTVNPLRVKTVFCLRISSTYPEFSIWHTKNYMVDKYLQNKGEISCPKSSISIMSEHMSSLALWALLFFFLILDVVEWVVKKASSKKKTEKKKAGSLFKGPVKLKSELLPFLSHVTLAKSVDLGSITCKIVTQ